MFSKIRRHATYANVAATLALFLSLGGTAIAAKHYLITSKKQISPVVLHALKGKPGATGRTGATGATGPAGAAGAPGSAIARALIVVNAVGNPILTENAGFTSVTEPQPGVFCLNPAYPGHVPVVSPASVEAFFAVVSPQQCPGGNEIRTNQEITGGAGFSVLVP